MATLESVKNKIQSLIDKSNDTTGNSDTDLTEAVLNLADGYCGGLATEEYDGKYIVTGEPELPSDVLDITENGIYNVSEYLTATVNVPVESPHTLPTEISSEEEMTEILITATSEDNGRIYKYVGESGTYTQNAYYKIEVK